MAQKNETLILVPILLIALAVLGSGIWWLWDNFNRNGNNRNRDDNTALEAPNTFGEVSNVPSGSFSYLGTRNWEAIQETIDPIIRQVHPRFRVRYIGSITATSNLKQEIGKQFSDNQITFSQISRPLTNQIGDQTIELDGSRFRQIPVAVNAIAVAVNHNLKIASLNREQLRAIYTGEIRNWKQLGGPDLEIIPYSHSNPNRNTVKFFSESVLKGETSSSAVKTVNTPIAAFRQVANHQGAIYYGAASQIVRDCSVKPLPLKTEKEEIISPYQGSLLPREKCRNPGETNQLNLEAFQSGAYPLVRPWFIVFPENGSPKEQAGKTYAKLLLTEQGQHLIRNLGLTPLR